MQYGTNDYNYYAQSSRLSCACPCVFVCKECDDPVTITPTDDCINTDTTFTCTAPGGHPGSPSYSWTHAGATTARQTLLLSSLGVHAFTCDARYRHQQCPEFSATCSATHTVTYYGQYCTRHSFIHWFTKTLNHRWQTATECAYLV